MSIEATLRRPRTEPVNQRRTQGAFCLFRRSRELRLERPAVIPIDCYSFVTKVCQNSKMLETQKSPSDCSFCHATEARGYPKAQNIQRKRRCPVVRQAGWREVGVGAHARQHNAAQTGHRPFPSGRRDLAGSSVVFAGQASPRIAPAKPPCSRPK